MRHSLTIAMTLVMATTQVAGGQPVGGSIVQPVDVTTSYTVVFGPNFGGIRFVFDQSGLPTPYVSGQTAFDSYVTATEHIPSNTSMMLINSNGVNQPGGVVELGGTITLDLGAELPVDAVALWTASSGEGITRMAVHTDDDADFDNGGTTPVGTFDVQETLVGQPFEISAVETRFVHIEVLGHSGSDFIRHGEFAVRAADPVNDCPADTNGDGEL
ncbi:MAG: hypothetical protein AAFY46_17280, partial [Planctomycetota bacterium]